MFDAHTLPVVFIGLMGLAIFVYAILDGYDLGVGIMLPMDLEDERYRDIMIASIGPFWDANETWLVLAVGIMLIAFPQAHSVVLFHLYIPATLMLIGLIMRGVAFDFRAKAAVDHKYQWDRVFKLGSLFTTLCQGYMLGRYVTGFESTTGATLFSCLSAIGVTAAYSYIGGAWLIMKTENRLQKRAIKWTRISGWLTLLGIVLVSIVNLMVNPDVFSRWFAMPLAMFVLLIPLVCMTAFWRNDRLLKRLPLADDRQCWVPFLYVISIFLMSFLALAFSFFPDIVPGKLDIWQAASAPETLRVILWGALIVVPVILVYTAFAYKVFHGKATDLHYH